MREKVLALSGIISTPRNLSSKTVEFFAILTIHDNNPQTFCINLPRAGLLIKEIVGESNEEKSHPCRTTTITTAIAKYKSQN